MSVIVYGRPGASLEAGCGSRFGRDYARRGAFFERMTGGVLEGWLADAPGHYHLLHDLTGLGFADARPDLGLDRMDVGRANFDHVVLGGAGWLLVNAKGIGKGTLCLDEQGRGVLVREDGEVRRQPWLDKATANAYAGMLRRLTGAQGSLAWVVPDWTVIDQESLAAARCLQLGPEVAAVVTAAECRAGALERLAVIALSGQAPPVPAEAIETLARFVWDKTVPSRPGAALAPHQGPPDVVRGERHPRAKLTETILAECRA
jgi:hypothetical protein